MTWFNQLLIYRRRTEGMIQRAAKSQKEFENLKDFKMARFFSDLKRDLEKHRKKINQEIEK